MEKLLFLDKGLRQIFSDEDTFSFAKISMEEFLENMKIALQNNLKSTIKAISLNFMEQLVGRKYLRIFFSLKHQLLELKENMKH